MGFKEFNILKSGNEAILDFGNPNFFKLWIFKDFDNFKNHGTQEFKNKRF